MAAKNEEERVEAVGIRKDRVPYIAAYTNGS